MTAHELSAARRANAAKAHTERYKNRVMITPNFYPGQRVVCINDEFTILKAQDPSIVTPVQDKVYTIRKNFQLLHDVGVALEEIDNKHAIPAGRKLEPNFSQSRFRAVNEQQLVKVKEEVYEEEAVAA